MIQEALYFSVVTVNDEHMKSSFKRKRSGHIFKEGICAELCLKHWFESDWYFCNIAQSGWFWKSLPRKKVLNHHFLKSVHVTSRTQMFFKIGVLENIAIFTGKHLCWSLCFKNTSVGYFCQFDKITVQWAYADLLFLLKNIMWAGFC